MGRVAIVTGGTRGIGKAICMALKAAGHTVAATYHGNDEAAQAFTQALALSPHLKEAHHLLGFCCFKLEEYQQAVECFEKVIELDPGSAIDYANLGINLQRLGHPREAAYVLKQALDLDSSLDFAARALEAFEE